MYINHTQVDTGAMRSTKNHEIMYYKFDQKVKRIKSKQSEQFTTYYELNQMTISEPPMSIKLDFQFVIFTLAINPLCIET